MAKTAFLHPFARPAADEFVNIVRGEGAAVWDDDGNRYVDAMASLWYCQVGHGRLEIAEAVAAQMGALEACHTFEMFTNDPAERLCAALAKRSPIAGAWANTGKPLYHFVTRRLLGWADREGAGGRGGA